MIAGERTQLEGELQIFDLALELRARLSPLQKSSIGPLCAT